MSIEGVVGHTGNDTLIGNKGDNLLYGELYPFDLDSDIWNSHGDDSLDGGAGNDTIFGTGLYDLEVAKDTLTGGSGADHFIFSKLSNNYSQNQKVITDFVAVDDTIIVADDDFFFDTGLTLERSITSAQFRNGGAAVDSSDRFIYNTVNGNGMLFFDRDGIGGNEQKQVATLLGAPTINHNDIFITSRYNLSFIPSDSESLLASL